VCNYCDCPPRVDPGCPPRSMMCAFPCPTSSSSPAAVVPAPDPGLLSVYNDAMNNCEAVPDYTAWAISNGFKSVPKGTPCGEGFVPSSSTPAAMTGNAQYDVCFQARRGGITPFPDGLVARLAPCFASSGSPSPSGFPQWMLILLIICVILLPVLVGTAMFRKST
jgi:hypothetical protein